MSSATPTNFVVLIVTLMLWEGAAGFASERQVGNTSPIPTGTATLVIFNDSGPSMIPFKLSVKENDRKIVNLSRHEYERVSIAPGRHVYNVPPRNKPRVVLDAEAGETYYLVAAYKPERSYVPFASPFVLKQISEAEAGTLAARMTEKIGVMPENNDESEPGTMTMHALVHQISPQASPSSSRNGVGDRGAKAPS